MLPTIPAKTIVTKTKSSAWFGTNYTMNIYKGCCHGCIYCDSRSACYGVNNFDVVKAKENALLLIRNDLRRKVQTGIVGTGSMSDPYNPYERECELTCRALTLLDAYQFGVAIATKSDLIVRDIPILQNIQEHSPVICKITVTAGDDALSNLVEPHAPSSTLRFEAVEKLARTGIFTGILLTPLLPFIEDNEKNIRDIIIKAKGSGARFVFGAFGMTLRDNQREWYYDRLEEIFPGKGLKNKYVQQFGNRYQCSSPRIKELYCIFKEECDRHGLLYKMTDIVRGYTMGYGSDQLRLF